MEALQQGLNLTIIGMTIVFVFLILLVLLMKLNSYLVKILFGEETEEVPASKENDDRLVAAAIAIALREKAQSS
jgi:sodium pump decarboxylase gamma subunit